MHLRTATSRLLLAACTLALVGCEADPEGTGGRSGAGGNAGTTSGTAGAMTGGSNAMGGAGAGAGGASGTSTSGTSGISASGGTPASGGVPATGGALGGGGQTSNAGNGAAAGMTANGGTTGGAGAAGGGGMPPNGGQSGDSTSGGAGANGGGLAAGGSMNTAGSAGSGPTFHVFLLLGQSNMAGYAKAEAADKVEDARIRVLGFDACTETGRQVDQWDTAAPPLHECWNSAVGPGDHFAKTLLGSIPSGDTIGLVPCAISGERIETFLKVGGSKYAWILERARLAQEAGGVIEGMIFHQGESNTGDSSWPGKVNTLVTDLRGDLEIGNVPFLAGELPYDGNSANHNPLVNQLATVVVNGHVVSASGLVVDPADTQWNLHFDHDSTVTLGERYAQKMIEALDW